MCLTHSAPGQSERQGRDRYTLLTTPYNRRPLALFRGQFQADAGYKFAVRTQSYNSEGNIVKIDNNRTGSVYHYYMLNLRYGLTDFIELGAQTNMVRHGEREASTAFTSASLSTTDRIMVNKLTEVRGMGDILLLGTVRLPIRYRWFDLSATGGLFLPSSGHEPEKPANSVTNITSTDSYTVNYRYNYKYGYGVPVYLISGALKAGLEKFTAELQFAFRTPMREGTNIRWEENLVNKVFYYDENSYSYLLSNAFSYNASLHYQAAGWFDIYLNGNLQNTNGGWYEYYGRRYSYKSTSMLSLEPGFELQVSPCLRICQVAGFPLSGKNSEAPFYLYTTVRYSIFPLPLKKK